MKIRRFFRLHVVSLVTLLLIGTVIFAGCDGNNGSAGSTPQETTPPEVYTSHDPISPQHGDYITFIAAADDESGVDTIAIFVNGENVEECHGNSSITHLQCDRTLGPYSQGQTVEYYAYAVDCKGNDAKSYTKHIIVGP